MIHSIIHQIFLENLTTRLRFCDRIGLGRTAKAEDHNRDDELEQDEAEVGQHKRQDKLCHPVRRSDINIIL